MNALRALRAGRALDWEEPSAPALRRFLACKRLAPVVPGEKKMEIVMLKKILGSRLLSHARTRRVRAAMALTPLALGAVLVACGGGGSDAA
ncbi:MAG TPA: hypothetical protein VMS38_15900, partial [Pseudorhodoferax sp.]|nr:hypothetical protein [Pseudorhodoferax sp.]